MTLYNILVDLNNISILYKLKNRIAELHACEY